MTPRDPSAPWRTLEEVASGWALDRIARKILGEEAATASDLAHAVRGGNAAAAQAWNQAIEYWGVAFANVATLLCPNRIVVGGGVALQGDSLLQPLRDVFRRNVFAPFVDRSELVLAELGETMVVQGALLLAGITGGTG
jgi:glucokinase